MCLLPLPVLLVQLTLSVCLFIKATLAASFLGVVALASSFSPFEIFFICILRVWVFANMFAPTVCKTPGKQTRASNPLELEIETHVGAGS